MKPVLRLILFLLLNIIALSSFAQNVSKFFLDYDRKFVDSSKAVFYQIYNEGPDTVLKSGSIEVYFMNGTRLKRLEYQYDKNDKRTEKEIYYYDNGAIESITNSVELHLIGEQLAYFPDGKIKRKAFYSNNEMVTGQCYTMAGKDTSYYEDSGRMPSFPGGPVALQKFISDNLLYPKKAKRKGITGIVKVQILIDKFGNIEKAGIIKSVDPMLDDEVMRVISKMPKWTPGFQKDQLLSMTSIIPVEFKLKN